MRFSVRRFLATLVAPVVIGALTTCSENNATSRPPAPVTRWAGLSFTPAFSASSKQAAAIYQLAGIEFDRVRVVITRPPTETLKDTTVTFTVGQSDLVLDLEVPAAPGEQLTAQLEYRAGTMVLFAGSATLTAQALTATSSGPPSKITVTPVGPGATAASVAVSPASGTFPATAPVGFSARALTASGTDIDGALFVWSVDNPAVAAINATTGVVTPVPQGGAVRVRATTLNGTFGEASVTFSAPPARIVSISGSGQTGVVGAALGQAFIVEVQSATGTPVGNQVVTFGTANGASVSPATATTGANGRAQTTMTLGKTPATYGFAASVAAFSTSVSALATVGPAASIAAVSGGGQTDTVKKALQNPFVVKVTDQFSNPVANATVTWNRTAGSGSLSASTTTTNADGVTNVVYTLGTKVGSESVSASVAGVSATATFTVQALPTPPAAIVVVSGAGQTGRATQPLDAPFVVTVADDAGNPVSGAPVRWTATNGTIPPSTTTDALGVTSNTLTLGSTVGPASATATVGAGATAKSVAFTVAVQPGVVARVAFRAQPPSGTAGVALAPPIRVELLDAAGNLTAATNTVSIALGSNPAGATLGGTLTRAAVAGVATFDDVTLSTAGTGYTVVASSAGVPSLSSSPFDIAAAAPVAVQFLTQPSSVVAGSAIAPAVQVRLVNALGATATTATNNVTIAIGTNAANGTLAGTLTVAAVNGVATFSNLSVNNAGNGYTLAASSANLTPATSAAFNVTAVAPPPAVGVAFQVAPSNVSVGAVMAPAVTVRAIDAQGNTVSGFTGNVTVAIGTNPATGVLGGTLTRAAVAGVATFNDLTVNAAGNGYTLAASSTTGLTGATSAAFNVIAGPPPPAVAVAFQVGPSNVSVATVMTPPVTVRAIDAQGNTVTSFTSNVTIAIGTNPANGTLTGTLTVAAVNGVATFSNLSVNNAGNGYTLAASSANLTPATSAAFNVTAVAPPPAVGVAFQVAPSNVSVGAAMAPAVTVRAIDAQGNTVTGFTGNVTVAIGTNPATGVLGGTLTRAAVAGVATFNDLTVSVAGNGYTLVASSTTGLTGATSAAFNVIAGPPPPAVGVAFQVAPSNVNVATVMAPAVTVRAIDAQGNTVTGFTGNVTVAIGTNPAAGALGGTLTRAAVAGVATFNDLTVNAAGTGYTLVASSTTGLTGATSAAFNVIAGPPPPAVGVAFQVAPSNVSVGAAIAPAVTVRAIDAQGNTVAGFTGNVTLAIGTNPATGVLGGTLTRAAVAGVATFNDLTVSVAGNGYTLVASSTTGLTGATSAAFNVTPLPAVAVAFQVGPSNANVATAIAPAVTVRAIDAQGNTVAGFTGNVTLAIGTNPASGVLGGTLTRAAVAGIATFNDLTVSVAANGYALVANSTGLTAATSAAFNVIPGPPPPAAAVAFQVAPSNATVGVAMAPAVTVRAIDAQGNLVLGFTGNVTVAIGTNPGSATLGGTLTRQAISGVATFNDLTVSAAGNGYTLIASSPSLTTATSVAFNVTAAPPVAVAAQFLVQPSNVAPGNAIAPAVQVRLVDAQGATVTAATNNVTVAIGTNPGSATLSGTLTVAAVNGVATFANLSVNNVGNGYTLTASPTGLASATSTTFNVTAASQTTIAWSNPAGGQWNVPANWSLNRVPVTSDSVVIALAGNYTVTLNENFTASYITIGAGSGTDTLAVTSGAVLTVNNAVTVKPTGVFSPRGSTVAGPGVVNVLNQGAMIVNGGNIVGAALTTAAGSLVRVEGRNGNAVFTVTSPGGWTNNGAIELTSFGAGFSAQLAVSNGPLVNASGATITSLPGAAGPRTLSAQLVNQGLLTVNQALTLSALNTAHTSTGTIDVSGGDLTVTQSGASASISTSGAVTIGAGRSLIITGGTLNLSGTLGGAGTLNLSSVTANLGVGISNAITSFVFTSSTFSGSGTITNAVGKTLTLVGSTITSATGLTNLGTLVTRGSSAIDGPVTTAAGSLLRVEGNNGNAVLNVGSAGGLTNNGAIELTSFGSGFSSQLTVGNGSLTNASGGTITSVAGAAGPRTLAAQLINQGLLTVSQPLTLSGSGAAHTNSGTIDVSGADLSVTQSGASPSLTTSGTVTIGAGRSLIITGGTLNLNGGTLGGPGTLSLSSVTANLAADVTNAVTALTMTSSTINGPGTITNATGKTLTILGSTIAATSGLTNQGTVVVHGSTTINGSLTNAAGSMLRVEGNNGNAVLTAGSAGGLTNNGAIELTSFGSGFSSQLTVSNGPLTNTSGATITSVPGAAGPRTLAAQLINQGLLTVNQPLTLSMAGAAHTNSGTIDVSGADLTLTQSGASPSITTSGTVTIGAGRSLFITGGTMNLTGGTLAGTGTLNLSSVTANLGVNITNAITSLVVAGSTFNGPGTITNAPGKTLTISGSTITATSGLTNLGTIVTRGSSAIDGPVTTAAASIVRVEGNNGNSTLTVGSTGGLTNNGAIELTSFGSGFSSQLTVSNGPLTNASGGTITSVPGANGPRTLAAQLVNQGLLTVNQALTLGASGAAHTNSGTIDVSGADLTVNQSGTSPSITTSGTVTIGAGRTLFLSGGTLNLSGGTLGGSGTLNLSSVTANLAVDVTNAITTLTVVNSTINGPGTITNATGKTLTISGSTIGATSGLTNQGTVVARGSTAINGSLTTVANSVLRVEGNNGNSTLTVGSTGGLTNNGSIEIISVGSSFASQLTVTNGPLTNASGGTITSLAGAAGPRTLSAQLVNQGIFTVNQALTLIGASAAHSNAGTINVNANLTVTQSGGSPSFTNSGTATIAAGQTWSITDGAFTHQAGATLNGGGAMSLTTTTAAFNAGFTLGALTLSSSAASFQNNLSTAALALNIVNSTVSGPGTITVTDGQTLTLQGSTIAATSGLTNQGIVVVGGTSAINGPLATVAGSTLRMLGSSNGGNGTLTVNSANGFTNNGTIDLTTVGSSFQSQLTVSNGTLTNAVGGTITTSVGALGPRTITAPLNNQGVVTVNQPLTLNAANAVHANPGTLNVNAGLTVTQTGGSASFTNSGTATIAAGQTWSISGGTFTQQTGATLNGGGAMSLTSTTAAFNTGFALGALSLSSTSASFQNNLSTAALSLSLVSSTINGPGTITNPSGQTLTMQASTIAATSGLTNEGVVITRGTSVITGPLTTVGGSTLRLEGSSNGGNSMLTVSGANGLTNNGAIEMTTTGSSFLSQLTVPNGPLTNAVGGTITTLGGAGGPRTIAAQLDNQGGMTVIQPLTLVATNAAHTNSGTLSITGPSMTITQSGAAPSFTNTGTLAIGGPATLSISAGTFTQQTGATLNGGGALSLTGVTSAAFKTNFTLGALNLASTTASFQNDVSTSGLSLSLASSTINGPGIITNVFGQTLALQASTIAATSALTNQGTVIVSGASAVNGLLTTAANSTLRMEGSSNGGNSTLTVGAAEGLVNNGAIDLTTSGSSFASQLTVTNGTLTNAAGATITTSLGAGGPRTLAAELNNQGLLTVIQPLTITRANAAHSNSGTVAISGGDLTITQTGANATFSNSGTANVSTGRTWIITGGTFTQQAGATLNGPGGMSLTSVSSAAFNTSFTLGALSLSSTTASIQNSLSTATTGLSLVSSTINGPGVITNPVNHTITMQASTIGSSSGLTNQGTVSVNGASAINGLLTTATGSLLRIQGSSNGGNANLTIGGANLNGVSNIGTIDLTTSGSSFASQLTVPSGVLVNANGGTITSSLGAGGPRTIAAAVDNQGIMTVASGGSQLLTITGSLVTSGTINLEIAGLTPGTQYDRIAISGAATLGGTLNVALNGFAPAAGNVFDVLTFGSATGDFGTYVLPSAGWAHARQGTVVRLTAP